MMAIALAKIIAKKRNQPSLSGELSVSVSTDSTMNRSLGLRSPEVIDQKVDYIHNNPVVAGFVTEAHYWKYSSAIDYSGGKGMLEIDFV